LTILVSPFFFTRNVWCPASSGNGLSGSF
jgi:hypothetical protein